MAARDAQIEELKAEVACIDETLYIEVERKVLLAKQLAAVEKLHKHRWGVHRAHWVNPEGYPKGWDRCVLMREDAILLCDALQARSR